MAEQLDMFAPRPPAQPASAPPAPSIPLIEHDMGGAYTIDRSIPCIVCGRTTLVRVAVDGGDRSADPRGVCGLQARVSIEPEEYGFDIGEPAYACWDCFEEKGREGQQRALDRAARAKGWRRSSAAGTEFPSGVKMDISASKPLPEPSARPDTCLPSKSIGEDVLRVLSACVIDEDRVKLPGARLDRKLYLGVNEVLEALGGKWNRKAQAHVFAESPADVLDAAITSGRIVLPKDLGWFPTPEWLAKDLVALANVQPGMGAIEPSAGEGAIVRALHGAGAWVHAWEIDPRRAEVLRTLGCAEVNECDFLSDARVPLFHRVVMNPPFGKRVDVAHVRHAFGMLAPGGRLVSVMSAGVRFRQDKLASDFRALVERSGGSIEDLPEGSFVESGTAVRTVVVTLNREAA